MRLFQNSGINKSYAMRLDHLALNSHTFQTRLDIFLNDRYGASHFLKPVLDRSTDAFFTNGDDEKLQRAWARENGLPRNSTLSDILLAQIEDHETEVFYNLDPMRYGNDFLARLPGCVKNTICWRAAPSNNQNFSRYNLRVCNFPSILNAWEKQGLRAAYLAPAYDPAMDEYAASTARPIDVVFVGGYTQHHLRRAKILEAVSRLSEKYRIAYYLDQSRLAKLAESPLGYLLPIRQYRLPKSISAIRNPPVFGRALYHVFSQSKIVINAAVDMAGDDRGNMRCFEATGCGALLLSDQGQYPPGFVPLKNFQTYDDPNSACDLVESMTGDVTSRGSIASQGWAMIRTKYSKELQWLTFQSLVAKI